MNKEIITYSNVTIGYGKKAVLGNLNLSISKNDFVGLVGPNGSGKTTFLKTLLGNIKPLSGKIKKSDLSFGYVPQRDTVQPLLPYTVNDVVMMGRYSLLGMFKTPTIEDKNIVEESLARVGINDLNNLNYNSLSGGQRQRTLIARALAVKPDVLILDEPTNGMDTPSHHSLLSLISDLNEKDGLTILLVSHLLTDVANLVEKLMLFETNSFQFGNIDDVLSEENLGKIYGSYIEVKKVNGDFLITSKHTE